MGWTRTDDELPTNGAAVEARIRDTEGVTRTMTLYQLNGHWYAPGGVRVWYVPTHWRPIAANERQPR